MEVIRFILNEEDIKTIGQDMLDSLARCSTSSVMMEVKRYISNPKADKEVVSMVKKSFSSELAEMDSENNEELLEAVSVVTGISYSDISNTTPTDILLMWQKNVGILREKGALRPYKSAVKSYTIKEIIEELGDRGLKDIAKKISAKKNVFSEISTARAVGTPFKQAYFQSVQIEIKERGIDFLLRMKKAGNTPLQWRFL